MPWLYIWLCSMFSGMCEAGKKIAFLPGFTIYSALFSDMKQGIGRKGGEWACFGTVLLDLKEGEAEIYKTAGAGLRLYILCWAGGPLHTAV